MQIQLRHLFYAQCIKQMCLQLVPKLTRELALGIIEEEKENSSQSATFRKSQ